MRRAATPATKTRSPSRARPSAMKDLASPVKKVVQGQGAAIAPALAHTRNRNAAMAFMASLHAEGHSMRGCHPHQHAIDLGEARWSNPHMSDLAPLADTRRAELEAAQAKALALFDAIERDGLVRPGVSER